MQDLKLATRLKVKWLRVKNRLGIASGDELVSESFPGGIAYYDENKVMRRAVFADGCIGEHDVYGALRKLTLVDGTVTEYGEDENKIKRTHPNGLYEEYNEEGDLFKINGQEFEQNPKIKNVVYDEQLKVYKVTWDDGEVTECDHTYRWPLVHDDYYWELDPMGRLRVIYYGYSGDYYRRFDENGELIDER